MSGGPSGADNAIAWIFFPLVTAAFGLVASFAGLLVVRPDDNLEQPDGGSPVMGFYVVAALLGGLHRRHLLLDAAVRRDGVRPVRTHRHRDLDRVPLHHGILTAGLHWPVGDIAEASKTGPATNIISGIAVGFETVALPALTIGAALLSSYWLGDTVDFPNSTNALLGSGGIFGTAVATMGMLMAAAYVLAMDCFGPITDNAGGIVEMSGQPESVRDVTDALDSAGNTTKALTKGYAVGSAALAAFLLFSAFLDEVRRFGFSDNPDGFQRIVNLAEPKVFVGGLIGAALVYVFASFAIRAVGKSAETMIEEVRRQFKANPGILKGTAEPDYAACVDISVRSALRQMVLPGSLVVVVPILVGIILRWEAAAGMLMIGTIAGVLLAVVLNNGGGAWDNAKKYIEAGNLYDGDKKLGKGSTAHAAAVVGDTVGDPFKDTAGPSLHVLVEASGDHHAGARAALRLAGAANIF
ncbi:MAG: sodium/proton-translocating pyrophosphatase [Thermomicrobiales bacterium]